MLSFHAFHRPSRGEADLQDKLEGGEANRPEAGVRVLVFSEPEGLWEQQGFLKTISGVPLVVARPLVAKRPCWAHLLDLSGTWYLG